MKGIEPSHKMFCTYIAYERHFFLYVRLYQFVYMITPYSRAIQESNLLPQQCEAICHNMACVR